MYLGIVASVILSLVIFSIDTPVLSNAEATLSTDSETLASQSNQNTENGIDDPLVKRRFKNLVSKEGQVSFDEDLSKLLFNIRKGDSFLLSNPAEKIFFGLTYKRIDIYDHWLYLEDIDGNEVIAIYEDTASSSNFLGIARLTFDDRYHYVFISKDEVIAVDLNGNGEIKGEETISE